MKRSPFLTLLYNYLPSAEETEFKKKFINFVEENINCFERSLDIGHVTASSWLLNKDKSKALLMHHAKLNQWFQLGGHCDGDPDVLAVALKEAHEESGLTQIKPISKNIFDIDIHQIPANSKDKAHYHYDVRFLLQSMGSEELIINRESKELRWIEKNKKDLMPTGNRSVIRMFEKWSDLLLLK